MSIQVLSGVTSFPNTPESDRMPYVMNDVSVSVDGEVRIVRISAADPLDAMEKVRKMSKERILGLRVVSNN